MTPQIAHEALALAIKVEAELKSDSPLIEILARSRSRALTALVGLVNVDPNDAQAILQLQLEIRLYADLIEAIADIQAAGDDATQRLDQEQREAVLRDLMPEDEGESE